MNNHTISFEYFPPKTEVGKETLHHTALVLAALQPQFFSVTFGAGGSTQQGTIETVLMLQQNTNICVAPHLSCVGASRLELLEILKSYKTLGVKRIVVLRGDLPSGMGQVGELRYASQLVALIREQMPDCFHIEVAAYPECHPQSKTVYDDIIHFKKKVDAGANSAITQYFYNTDAYFYYLEECRKHDIRIPIVPGVMPITNYAKLMRFSEICGAEIPRWICRRLENYAEDAESIKAFGIEVVYRLAEQLILGGAPGLHFYTLNHAEPTKTLLTMLQPLLQRGQ